MTSPRTLRLGILDLGAAFEDMGTGERIAETVRLARRAEELGFERYWLSEHHTPSTVLVAPEVVLGLLSGATSQIKIGSAGVLLRYYSPLKIIEVYLTLAAMAGPRVELGVCYGPGVPDDLLALSYASGNEAELSPESFQAKVDSLVGYARLAGRPGAASGPLPLGVAPPPIWVLGSGSRSLELAARNGASFGFMCFYPDAHDYGPRLMAQFLRARDVRPDRQAAQGAVIALSVNCAATDAAAEAAERLQLERGMMPSNIVGSPDRCIEAIHRCAKLYGVVDVVVACASPHVEDHLLLMEGVQRAAA